MVAVPARGRQAAGMPSPTPALTGWYVISLRPQGQHAALRRAAAAHGARLLAVSPWRIAVRDDAATRAALRAALAAPRVVFTSPNAVRAALALARARPRGTCLAVGAGTARALRRAGIAALAPQRMDSEGVLALAALGVVAGQRVGLVTGAGGRDRIAPNLRARGATVLRADVYAREPVPLARAALARLRAADGPWLLALSSGEALQHCLAQLPDDLRARLRRARVVCASARLAALARELGFAEVVTAANAQPRALLAAGVHAASGSIAAP